MGEEITYTPAGGAAVTPTAIVGPERTEEDETFDGRRRRRVRQVTITRNASGAYGGVASPSITATVTIGGVEYAVEDIAGLTGSSATLDLVRRDKIETGRENYRRK